METVAWGSGDGSTRATQPPHCRVTLEAVLQPINSRGIRLWATFPDCWDGETVTTGVASRHVADSVGGRCPGSHPVPIPQLEMAIDFHAVDPDGLSLASGGIRNGSRRLLERLGSTLARGRGAARLEPRPRVRRRQQPRRSIQLSGERLGYTSHASAGAPSPRGTSRFRTTAVRLGSGRGTAP